MTRTYRRVGRWQRPSILPGLLATVLLASPAAAHEIENTHVLISFLPESEYRIDVLNDADWLWLQFHPGAAELPTVEERDARLAALAPQFVTGITLLFDGRAVAPSSVTYLPPLERDRSAPMGLAEPGLMRVSGTVPADARTFQFGYDLVIDEYPLTVAPAVGTPVTRWLLAAQLSEGVRDRSLAAAHPLAGGDPVPRPRVHPHPAAGASITFSSSSACSSSAPDSSRCCCRSPRSRRLTH